MKKKITPQKRSKLNLLRDLKKLRILVLDVDGVLTDGKIFWIQGQGWVRSFHVHDGYGIRLLKRAGIQVAVFSGSQGLDIEERMKVLGISYAYLGNENKLESLDALVRATGIQPSEMAYMGDDLFDIPVLKAVRVAFSVPQAPAVVKKSAHYVTQVQGGSGAVREVADLILKTQGHQEPLVSEKLSKESQSVDQNQQS